MQGTMSSNQAHASQKDHPHPGVTIVTRADFEAVNLEAPIHNHDTVDCPSLGEIYKDAYDKHKQASQKTPARVFRFVAAVLFMHFKFEDTAESYGPDMQMNDGRRSIIPSDLRGEQSDILAAVAPNVENPGLRARLSDIAWINKRQRHDMARLAINAYCDAVQRLGNTADLSQTSGSSYGTEMLHRACQIVHMLGWKDPEGLRLKTLIQGVIQDVFDRKDHWGFMKAAKLSLQFSIDDPATLAEKAEELAGTEVPDAHVSHDLWKFAADAHHKIRGNDAEYNRCRKSAAECLVALANAYGGKGMIATNYLMRTIQELRCIPNTQERRQQLEAQLREAQTSIPDEMHTRKVEVDLTESAEAARSCVSGLSLAHALRAFACLGRSPDPRALRKEAQRQAERHGFTSMIPRLIVDNEGKVTGKSPGFFSSEEDNNIRLRHIIAENEILRRQCEAAGLINPARLQIHDEHLLEQSNFLSLVTMSPFVPADRVVLFSLAFARFFSGDFLSALHILVPQLENSLRHVLMLAGNGTSSINNDMTQEDRSLSVLLSKDRTSLEKIFGPAIIYEIEDLFDFRGGPAIRLRHRLAHGLISDQACCNGDAIYACWFIFRLCCLRLLNH